MNTTGQKGKRPPPPLDSETLERIYHAILTPETISYCNREQAIAFIEDISEHFNEPSESTLKKNFYAFLKTTPSEMEVWLSLRNLASLLRETENTWILDRHDTRVSGPQFRAFTDKVNARGNGERRVVFVAENPYFMILREAMCLRRKGHRAYLVTKDPLPKTLSATFAKAFDAVVDARRNPSLLGGLLSKLRPDVFHVQCFMWNYALGRQVMEIKKDAAVVCEFYDITSIYADRDALLTNWSPAMVDFDFAMETYILQNADAVITRFPERIMAKWGEFHGRLPPSLEFQAYPCKDFTHYGNWKFSDGGSVNRLVYTGNLIPHTPQHPEHIFPEIGMPRAFRRLLELGIAIDVLHIPHAPIPEDNPDYAPFTKLAREFSGFRIMEGVPPERLAEKISPYDFGILFFDYDASKARIGENQRKGVIATKIFSYLEAGLPVLVNAEYENMASLVVENGLGLAVHSSDIDKIPDLIKDFDQEKAANHIKLFNKKHAMDGEIDRLITLYDDVSTLETLIPPAETIP